MAIDTEQKALNQMLPNGGMTITEFINDIVNKGILTEQECKDKIKRTFPNVTSWSI